MSAPPIQATPISSAEKAIVRYGQRLYTAEEVLHRLNQDIAQHACFTQLIKTWAELCNREPPSYHRALGEFEDRLRAHNGLTPEQIRHLTRTLKLESDAPDRQWWLQRTSHAYLRRTRPWYPLWITFCQYVFHWCLGHKHYQIAYLPADATPFRVISDVLLELDPLSLSLRYLYANRQTIGSALFSGHLRTALDLSTPYAIVDTGCYGTIIAAILDYVSNQADISLKVPAVFFLFSRNPSIFGYMNYLIMNHVVSVQGERRNVSDSCLIDFIVYAGDFLEILPKPFDIVDLAATGPLVAPRDLISFVLGAILWRDLRLETIAFAKWRPHALIKYEQTLISTFERIASRNDSNPQDALLLGVVPKDIPIDKAYLRIPTTLPQADIFGSGAG